MKAVLDQMSTQEGAEAVLMAVARLFRERPQLFTPFMSYAKCAIAIVRFASEDDEDLESLTPDTDTIH